MDKQQAQKILKSGKVELKPESVGATEDVVQLSLDDLMDLCVLVQEDKKEAEKQIKAVKAQIKQGLVVKGEKKYENPNGIRAYWVESRELKLDKELVRELLSDEDWKRVARYETKKSFYVK